MSGSSYVSYWRQETRLAVREADWDQRTEGFKNQVGIERRGPIRSGSGNMRMKSDNSWVG